MSTTATLDRHQHAHWAAPFDHDQDRAHSLHSEGQSEARFIKVRAIPVRKTSSSHCRCLTRQSHAEEPVALLSNLQLGYLVVSICSTVPLYTHAEALRLPQEPRQ